jgi:hypothetical protein
LAQVPVSCLAGPDYQTISVGVLRRLGVAEPVAMKISGHKTASVIRRYDIVEMADLADAAARLNAKQKSFGHTSGIVAEKAPKLVRRPIRK